MIKEILAYNIVHCDVCGEQIRHNQIVEVLTTHDANRKVFHKAKKEMNHLHSHIYHFDCAHTMRTTFINEAPDTKFDHLRPVNSGLAESRADVKKASNFGTMVKIQIPYHEEEICYCQKMFKME